MFVAMSTYAIGNTVGNGGFWSAFESRYYEDRTYLAMSPSATTLGGGALLDHPCISHYYMAPVLVDRESDAITYIGGLSYIPPVNSNECSQGHFRPNVQGIVRHLSADGTKGLLRQGNTGSSGQWMLFDTALGSLVAIPGLEQYDVIGMSPDGDAVYVSDAVATLRWTAGEYRVLATGIIARGFTGDGSLLIGSLPGCQQAAVWTEGTGVVRVKDLLANMGFEEVLDWNLFEATAVSADGRTITGTGYNYVSGRGEIEGWIAVIPEIPSHVPSLCPGDYNNDGGIDGDDVSVFFEDWEEGRPRADLSCDAGIDGADVEVFFRRWEGGC
jgi:hypothetical protein